MSSCRNCLDPRKGWCWHCHYLLAAPEMPQVSSPQVMRRWGKKPLSSSQISSKAPALKLQQFLRDESKRASLPPAGGRLHLGCDSASGLSPQGQIHRRSGNVPISRCRDFSCRELRSCPVASAARNSTAEPVQGACSPCASSCSSPQTPATGWEERSPEAAPQYEALQGQNKPPA